jgi:hypothetical protein
MKLMPSVVFDDVENYVEEIWKPANDVGKTKAVVFGSKV